MDRGLGPYRVLAFLEPQAARAFSHTQRAALEFDNLYALDNDWHVGVTRLIAFTPIVVVDTRAPTPGVVWEIERVAKIPIYRQRTIFVVEPSGKAPALVAAGVDGLIPESQRVPEDALLRIVKGSLRQISLSKQLVIG